MSAALDAGGGRRGRPAVPGSAAASSSRPRSPSDSRWIQATLRRALAERRRVRPAHRGRHVASGLPGGRAGRPRPRRRRRVVIVNAEPTPYDASPTRVLREPIGDVLPALAGAVPAPPARSRAGSPRASRKAQVVLCARRRAMSCAAPAGAAWDLVPPQRPPGRPAAPLAEQRRRLSTIDRSVSHGRSGAPGRLPPWSPRRTRPPV